MKVSEKGGGGASLGKSPRGGGGGGGGGGLGGGRARGGTMFARRYPVPIATPHGDGIQSLSPPRGGSRSPGIQSASDR